GPRSETFIERFAFAPLALTIDHVVAFAIAIDHLMDYGKWILQVGVENDDGISGGMIKAGSGGDLVAEITREMQHLHPRVRRPVGQRFQCAIGTAIVHQYDLNPASEGRRKRLNGGAEGRYHGSLVVQGNDERQLRRTGASLQKMLSGVF